MHIERDPNFVNDPLLTAFIDAVSRMVLRLKPENVPDAWSLWFSREEALSLEEVRLSLALCFLHFSIYLFSPRMPKNSTGSTCSLIVPVTLSWSRRTFTFSQSAVFLIARNGSPSFFPEELLPRLVPPPSVLVLVSPYYPRYSRFSFSLFDSLYRRDSP